MTTKFEAQKFATEDRLLREKREALLLALSDPNATTPRRDNEWIHDWQLRALMSVLVPLATKHEVEVFRDSQWGMYCGTCSCGYEGPEWEWRGDAVTDARKHLEDNWLSALAASVHDYLPERCSDCHEQGKACGR